MGKHSKVFSSTEWRLGENFVLRPMECLTSTVKFDTFITTLLAFVTLALNGVLCDMALKGSGLYVCL